MPQMLVGSMVNLEVEGRVADLALRPDTKDVVSEG
jgi:hypothetical protein